MRAMNIWSEMDRLLDDSYWRQQNSPKGWQYASPTEVSETDTEYKLSMDLPGLQKEQISVEFMDQKLIVSGERRNEKFSRSFSLPQTIDTEKIQARYENGVLELSLPKSEKALSRRIEIQ